MEVAFEELPVNHNLKCHVCGENEFEERAGFYYCRECGTKQEQIQHIEVAVDDEFDQEKLRTKKQKIHVQKAEKPQLTSWECYNYILRGFVEELLSFGAKEELKLMALQVWAAYLRRMEVAFFNRKQPDLPKFGAIYLQNDAETIYNHSARRKRKRKRNEDASCTSGGDSKSARSWRRSKRKLDESIYSLTSATSASAGSGLTSSTSTNTNKAIKIGFSVKARAYLKKKMPAKHLKKHEADAEGLLTCHKQPTVRELNRTDYKLMSVNIKQIYSILAIALNLIGDEIQLSDLVRFIFEGHIGTSNVLKYFPENIANNGKEILRKINFYQFPDKYSDRALREHIGLLCKNIGINAPKKPDLIKLVERYITELCLPKAFVVYIERLINLLPPNFATRATGSYPGFEARAMAYIIFTLKLFFGLDDNKEHRISRASQNLNSQIKQLNREKHEKQPLLFVWNEWVEYIEMRKVIVSRFNTSFCEQFRQCQSTNQLLEQMAEEMRRTEVKDTLLNDTADNLLTSQRLKTFRSLFEHFQETYEFSEKDKRPPPRIEFSPSLMPAHSYLKTIFLLIDKEADSTSCIDLKIPEFMRIDNSQRDMISYLQVKPLIEYFKNHQLKLNVHVVATNPNRQYIGIFRSLRNQNRTNYKLHRACFNVTENEWVEIVKNGSTENIDDLEFRTKLNTYASTYYEKRILESKRKELFDPNMNYDLNTIQTDTDIVGNKRLPKRNLPHPNFSDRNNEEASNDLQSKYSFELFSENDMKPIDSKDFITKPRRDLENFDLFEDISDEESVLNDDDSNDANITNNSMRIGINGNDGSLSSHKSFQHTTLEEFIKIEPISPKHPDLETVKENKNNSDKNSDALKMYISNMDCWMILGSILMMTKAQKTQLQDKFPRSFNWLLETCAQTINVEWSVVFEQLLCIETMFCLGINDPKTIKNRVCMNTNNPFKEIQMILTTYREIW